MNKTEVPYSQHLELRRIAGEIWAWFYEPISFKLAPGCWYRPDFVVMVASGELEVYETKASERTTLRSGLVKEKARIEDDANVKIKVSARLYDCLAHFVCWPTTGEWVLVPKN